MTSNILFILFLIGILYWHVKLLFLKNQTLRYKYKLYKLRDELRMLAIEKKVSVDSIGFVYLDSSISGILEHLDSFNVFAIFITLNKKRVPSVKNFITAIELEIEKTEHLSDIRMRYYTIIVSYILRKHFLTCAFFWLKNYVFNFKVTFFYIRARMKANIMYLIQKNASNEKYGHLTSDLKRSHIGTLTN